jgi:hypothetical protein
VLDNNIQYAGDFGPQPFEHYAEGLFGKIIPGSLFDFITCFIEIQNAQCHPKSRRAKKKQKFRVIPERSGVFIVHKRHHDIYEFKTGG